MVALHTQVVENPFVTNKNFDTFINFIGFKVFRCLTLSLQFFSIITATIIAITIVRAFILFILWDLHFLNFIKLEHNS